MHTREFTLTPVLSDAAAEWQRTVSLSRVTSSSSTAAAAQAFHQVETRKQLPVA